VRKALSLAFCLAACGQGDGNAGRAGPSGRPDVPRGPVQTATLTGLYESGGARPSQVCIVEQSGGARFGLVTREADRPGCSGAGTAVRAGDRLRLTMAGESACAIEARIQAGAVTFPAALPRGCAYYCAPGAPLAGLAFAKIGGTREDALRARDLVGDPLCG
jgi:hypothetical protein